ncbi:MAG: hypothetical protein ACD_3C00164G0001 [uncultured bacterium (gcode 4)]|uniref:Uncharacterized protein n=1 Tax=uncultured bacterium (gcode 4) TaxID=1234023 RepID=K2GBZ8_9BACT|nr:MAG: hypothetical protein ACD_3C00164G0001 [uncultured bacterium (gcode 4)]
MAKNLNPWTPAPKSGQYQQVWPRWWTANRPEVTVAKWERLPPTPEAGSTFTLVDPSKHS